MKNQYLPSVLKSLTLTLCCGLLAFNTSAQEEVIDFAGLSAGTLVAEQYAGIGVHISADADDGHPDLQMVFNTDLTGTADPDLEVGVGNIIIFPYNSSNVDDTPDGGKIYFDFDEDVTIISFDFIDKDNGTTGQVKVYDEGNSQIGTTININDAGNGSVQTIAVNQSGVRRLKIDHDDSGGVTNIRFTRDNGPPCGIDCYIPAEGELCFASPDAPEASAESIWSSEWSTDSNTGLMTLRVTLASTFVDNTYGSNTIGWPSDNHTFNHLKGSDHLQIALYDANDAKQLEFKMDYIDTDGSAPSGYSCLGLDGNGGMVSGNETFIVDITSSLDKNLNEFGYVLLTNSPATDSDYTPNPSYPNWIYEMWYEVTIDLAAFGNVGFGYPEMTSVHASPSKTGNNSEDVEPVPCIDCEEVAISVSAQVSPATICEGDEVYVGEPNGCCQSHGDHDHISGWNLKYVGPTSPASIDFITSDSNYGTTTYSGTHSFGDNFQIVANDRFDTNSEFTINGTTVDVHTSCSEATNVGFGIDSNGDFVPNPDPNDPNILFIIDGLATAEDGWCGLQSGGATNCNGVASVSASGGTAPYTYSWSDGSTQQNRTDLCAGTYTVAVTDANGCVGTTTVVVECDDCENTTISVNTSGTDVTCDSDNSNECEVVHYQNGGHAVWFNSLSAGTKHYKFEGGHGTLVENEDGTGHFSGIIYNTSNADQRWSVEVNLTDRKTWAQWSATGGQWKGDAGTVSNNYQDWGYYEIGAGSRMIGLGDWAGKELDITRNSNALQYRVQVGIAANDKNGNYGLSAWYDFSGDGENGVGDFNFDIQNCVEHGCDGTAIASASGGTAPYTYLWDNGMTTSSIDGLCAGQYCVSVVDANGCTSDEVCVTIGEESPCCDNITDGGEIAQDQSGCSPYDAQLLTSVTDPTGGSGNMEIVWITRPGTSGSWSLIPGADGLTYDPGVVTQTTQYRRCARREGCTSYIGESNNITITVYPGVTASCTGDNGNCANGNLGSASVSTSGGTAPFTYAWSNGGSTASINGLSAGTYSVTVTDANGCSDDCSVTITQVECCNVTDPGEIAANGSGCAPFDPPVITSNAPATGGIGPVEYVWLSGQCGTPVNTWAQIPNSNSPTYDPGVITETTCYIRCARNQGCTAWIGESNIITMTVTGPCCDNVTNGGIIAESQENCGGFDPDLLTSVSLPSGGSGAIEYIWLVRPIGGSYTVIPGATGPTYDPPFTNVSLQYRRCARRAGCTPWAGESNWVTITVHPNDVVATCSKVDGTCNNNNQGSASVSASGGTAPYTYLWSTGATTVSISNLTAGSYSVTVTDANGCSNDCSVTVTTTPCCNVTNGGQIAGGGSNCGPFDPAEITSASLPTGGLGDIEYVWLWNTQNVVNNGNSGWQLIPGANGATYDPGLLTETRCFLRCARRSGCTTYIGESNIVCFTVYPEPTASCSKVDGDCNNNNEASASVSASGGTAPYSYAWSNGATTPSIDGLSAGTYSVTVTDANGCTDDCSVTVTNTPCCNVTDPGEIAANQENCGPFDPAPFTSVAPATGGIGPVEYLWLSGTCGTPVNTWTALPNSNSETYDAGMVSTTTCFIRCARNQGCTAWVGESNIITITVNPGPTASCTGVDGNCNNNNEASASVSASGGTAPYSYAWSNGATTSSISGLAAGTYSVTVTDANGCTDDCSVTVSVTPCCNVTDGGEIAASQENCGPFDPAAFTSVEDPSGGLGDLEYVWLWNDENVPINNGQNGWVVIPNSNSATYDPGFLTESRCFIRCSRRSGCTNYPGESNVICITINEEPVATCSSVNGDCSNDNQASASVSASGGTAPYSYAWSNGATTASISGLAEGTYSVTVTDANGCTDDCSVAVTTTPCCNVTDPGEIAADQENCGPFDPAPFTSVAPATGGIGPVEYVWLSGQCGTPVNTWAQIPNSNSETYDPGYLTETTCFIRCARNQGCTAWIGESNIITITVNPGPTASCTGVDGNCNNNNEASASVSASGGTAPYSYAWSNGATTSSISGLAAGTYSVTVTDANGCTDDCSVTVSVTPCCNVTDGGEIAASQENCGPFDPAAFTSVEDPSGGLGDLEYVWLWNDENVPINNGQNGWVVIPNSNSATYDPGFLTESRCFIRCSRRSGCTNYPGESNVICVTINPEPVATCSSVDGDCSNDNQASASVSASGGTAPYTYLWSTGATTMSISNLTAGSYSVTVTDANGCTDDCSVTVTTTPCCNVTDPGEIAANQENCGPFDPAPFTSVAPATGGIGPVEYLWLSGTCGTPVNTWTALPNSNSETYDAGMVSTTTCFIRCARNQGCTAWIGESNIITITVNPDDMVATCNMTPADCNGASTGSATASVTGGTTPYTYAWSNGETTATISGLAAGTYSVTVTDANGCSTDCSVTVTEPSDVTAQCTSTNGGCNNNNQGSASVSAAGGTAPYTYAWSNGATTASISGLSEGTYSVTVTDANGCTETCSTTVTVEPCCNVTDPGEIAADQENCGPFDPAPFTSVAPATGGIGPVEYLWLSGTCGTPVNTWTALPNSNSETYDAGMVSTTTCFIRCSRNEGCTQWVGESNIITITVNPDNVVADCSSTPVDCNGASTGSVSVSPSGGTAPYTVLWSTGATTLVVNNLMAGSYSVTVTDANGCSETCTAEVEEPVALTADCSSQNGTCSNNNEASASVSAAGGTAPYSYAWSNGATTSSISGLAAGTYSVTVTDANGCVETCSVTVTTTPCCNVTDGGEIAADQENCGPFDPAAITSVTPATGGLGDLEYVWLWNDENVPMNNGNNGWVEIPGSNSESYDPGYLTESRCFIRCARRSGCTTYVGESNVICVTVNPVPVATCSSVNGDCNNNNEASASVSVAGGTAPFSYAWSNGATTASISGLAEGTYSVTVTDANGCSDDCSVTVTTTTCCDVTDPGTVAGSQEGCGPFDPDAFTSIAPASGGLGGIVYQWYQKETETSWMPIPGANGETYDPGLISINSQFRRCARREGCPEFTFCSNVLEIEIHPVPNATCSSVSGNCSNGNGASASVSVQGGTSPYTYLWSNGATTSSINDLSDGTYSVTVTDYHGCSDDCSVTVTTNECCNVTDPGEIAANQENCGPFDPVAFTSVEPASGGIGPVEYVWLRGACGTPVNTWTEIPNSNSETIDVGLVTETTCFIRCARNSGCSPWVGESNIITITVNDEPVATCSSINGDCNNNNEASASVSATGGSGVYSYAWSNGATTASISGLAAGTYTVVVTDLNGCSDECSVTVTTNPCCDVTEPGTVEGSQEGCGPFDPVAFTSIAPATGGLGDIEYQWYQKETETSWMPIPGATGETYDPGMISINSQFRRCARRSGCPEFEVCSNVLEIEIHPVPTATCSSVDGNCNNNNEASASVTVQGGTAPYSYAWSNGATTASIDGLAAGTYSVTVTDYNGCTSDCSVTVSVTPCCNVTDGGEINNAQENCGPFDPDAITSIAPATGGLGDLEYIWLMNDENVPLNNGQNGWVEIPGSNSETYDPGMITETTCFIRCARREGCTTYVGESNVVCMVVNESPVATCSSTDSGCNGTGTGTATVSATGGEAPYTYAWSNGGTTATITGLMAGSYSVTVTDANGCTDDCTATVGEPSGLTADCSSTDASCNGVADGTAGVSATGGSAPYTYAWSNGATTASLTGVAAGTYSVTVTDANGCTATCSATVSEPTALTADCSSVDGTCNNNNEASASVSVTGGDEPYSYAWSNGATTSSIDGLAAGAYSVTVIDANGCTADCSVTVSVTPCCNVTDGGEIAASQENCGPFDPAEITSVVDATGGLGDLEYVWLQNDENVPMNNGNNGWVEIPNSNSATYDPGMLTETTCFIRCARREGCTTYVGESNVVCMTVNEAPVATCTPVNGDCNNGNVASASVSVTGGTEPYSVLWSTGATTMTINNLEAGSYNVTVTDANGCEATCTAVVEITPCCNVTDGGEIAASQENCGPFDPTEITSVVGATGGLGDLEYVWLQNDENVPMNNGNNGWVEIPNSNSATYDPGMLTETTCFIRCARREGCTVYVGESNVVCITIFDEPVATCAPVNGDCNNGNLASASVSVSGGTEPFAYEWSNGATTASIDNLTAGTYSVTVTDANGCTSTCDVTVEVEGCCNVTDGGEIAGAQENCGPFDPAAFTSVVDPTGGLGDLEYVWLQNDENVPMNNGNNGWVEIPNSNSATYDPGMVTETTCYIRCARRSGCTTYVGESNVICVTVYPEVEVDCNPTHGDCSNNGVGAVSTTITGGTAPFTYAWSNGATTADISGLGEGTYSVTVTDANGCMADCSVTIVSEPCCNVTDGGEIAGTQENCGPFDPAAITSTVPATGGIGPVEYIWLWNTNNVPMNNGQNGWVEIPGSNSETYDPGMLTESRCFIRCARNVGCTTYIGESNVICVTVNEVPELTCEGVDGDCNNNNEASASVSVDGGEAPYTYAWSNGETTASISGLDAGTYSVTVTDANGCEATCSTTVEVTPCCNVTDPGAIAADQSDCGPFDPEPFTSVAPATGGIGPVEYLWLSGECGTPVNTWTPIANSNSETYDAGMLTETTCFIRCSRNVGCTQWVGESNIITITVGPGCCDNVTDGGEIAESQENCGPFDPEPFTSVSLPTGGSGDLEYVWLMNDEYVTYNNGNNGWVVIPGANGETYDPGMITETTCFIRCARRSGCEPYPGESNVICIIINPADLSATCTPVNGDCNNQNVGSASVSATGGEEPYTYEWSNGATTASIDGLAAGTYTVTVTDANGCTAMCDAVVDVEECCNVTDPGEIGYDQENCGPFDAAELVSLVDPTGGLGDLEIVWITRTGLSGPWQLIPGANGLTYDPGVISETTQFRRCVRREGCNDFEESNIITITILPGVEVECASVDGNCENENVGSASVTVLSGEAPYTYEWSNGATTASIENLEEGLYAVTVTDANGCTGTCTTEVVVTPCCNVTDPGEIAANQESCVAFDPDPIVSVAPASGGIGPVEYLWLSGECGTPVNTWTPIPGANGESYDPGVIIETTCFIRCARNQGCEPWIGESNIVTITIQNALTIECSSISGDCGNGNAASATVDVLDGTGPFSYEWSNGETTQTITDLEEGTYTVTVTDANGCTATCTESVIVTPCCNVTDPGEIAASQENCGPFDPDPIVSVAPASGGIGPVEYMWLSGECGTPVNTWAPISGADGESYDPGMLTETTCFVRCARNNGCEPWVGESNIVTITVYPAIELTCAGVDGDCTNDNIASATAHIAGGTEPYSILWSNGATTAMVSGLEAGTYTVVVTDASGCEANCSVTVTTTPCCNVTDGGEIAESQDNCGPFDPEAFTSLAPATGGIGPVEYAWWSGPCPGNDPTFGAIPPGFTLIPNSNSETLDVDWVEETTCYIRVARNQGCEEWIGESNILTLTVNPGPTADCSAVNGNCENGNLGSASVTVSGGPSPFSYEWSNGATTASITGLEAGLYTVTVTDGNGCTASCSVEVEVEGCCNVVDGGEIAASQENCGPFDPEAFTSVSPATGGIGPVEYAWWSGPCPGNDPTFVPTGGLAIPAGFTLIPNSNSETLDVDWVEETTCYIRVARNQGCDDWVGESNILTITINPGPQVDCSPTNGNCENGNLGSASVSVSGGPSPFTYEWSNGGTGASITGLEAGTYSVTVTDGNGCTASCSVEIEVEGCCNVLDGGEIAESQEGCGPFDPDPFTSLAPATGGVGPVEYAWYCGPCPGGDPTAIPPGFILVPNSNSETLDVEWVEETKCYIRVARNQGCDDWVGESNIITVTVNEGPEVDVVITDGASPTCEGGEVELTAQSQNAVGYVWSNGSTDPSIVVTEAGTYVVTVEDENGCTATDSIEVEVLPLPVVDITGGDPFCEGDSVMLTANCATAVGYSWSNGSNGPSIWVTEAGSYTVEVEDANGCTASATVEVDVLELPDVEIEVSVGSSPFCEGDSIQLTAISQNAVGYVWSTGSTDASIWVTDEGNYSVTVESQEGCENDASIDVETNPLPEVVVEITSGSNPSCESDSIQLTAISQTAQVFMWSTGETTESIWVNTSGNYCVMVGDGNGCLAEACTEVTFNENPAVEIVITSGANPFCENDSIELTAMSQNTVGYVWSNGSTDESIWVSEAGTYSVEVTDANGCSAEAEIAVGTVPNPEVEIDGQTEFCVGDSVRITAFAEKFESLVWSTGETSESIWVSEAGEYCVTVTSNFGCEAQACVTINAADVPDVNAGPDVHICDGDSTTLTATGGTPDTQYIWYVDGSVVGTTQSITVAPGIGITEYTVVAFNEFCVVENEDVVKVYVHSYPQAGFTRNPAGDVSYGSTVFFTDTTVGPVTDWNWDFGDGMTSLLQNPEHNYADPGSYYVTLIAGNHGCTDTVTAGLEVKIIIEIPNVFTPNNDGVNDLIWLQGTDLDMITMTVYNRWGHSVWASEGRQFSWSGKNSSGGDCEAGTYYYVIEMKYKDGNVSEQTGFFTLIREK